MAEEKDAPTEMPPAPPMEVEPASFLETLERLAPEVRR
jgi:hypothetical protein